MAKDGEDVDHIVMEVEQEKMKGLTIKLGDNGEHQDHDGVKLKIVSAN